MLPPVLPMHIVKSSHSESQSGGLVKLPRICLGEISQKSWFYKPFLSLPSRQGPHGRQVVEARLSSDGLLGLRAERAERARLSQDFLGFP